MGCGCLALLAAVVVALIFLLYASTDPGPPIEGAAALAALALLARIIGSARALGVPRSG